VAPAQGDFFLARGRVLRAGRRLTVCQADVFAIGGAESLVATMLSTIIVKQKQQL
jgi:acyl-coenzyme A thioesterase PaaI-like protein